MLFRSLFDVARETLDSGSPLIDDPFAEALVRAVGLPYFVKLLDGENPSGDPEHDPQQSANHIATRTRFYDDIFLDATRGGVTQAVILASGLDTRPYRLPWPAGTTVFEIDLPAVLDFKASVLAPIATRLVPPSHSGRATTAIYVGTSLALVVGIPLTSAMSLLWGWRLAVVVITVAAAAITLAARVALPALVLTTDQLALVGNHHHRNGRLVAVSALMLIAVTGHFISYTFIAVIIGDVVGVPGARLAWLLAAFGAAGLIAMPLLARPVDHRPKLVTGACMAAMSTAFVVLAALSIGGRHSTGTTVAGAAAIVLWGAMAMAVSPMLQSAAMRTAPDDPDGASGLYVTAFQVGITGGSLAGGLLFERAGTSAMLTASALLVGVAAVGIAASKRLFVVP